MFVQGSFGAAHELARVGILVHAAVEREHAELLVATPPPALPGQHHDRVRAAESFQFDVQRLRPFSGKRGTEAREADDRGNETTLEDVLGVGISRRSEPGLGLPARSSGSVVVTRIGQSPNARAC